MATNVRLVNNLPQKLPIVLMNPTSRNLEHAFIAAKGSRIVRSDEISEQLRGLARQGKVTIIQL